MTTDSVSEYAQAHGLKRMGARPPLLEYLKEAWVRRDFAIALSVYTNEASYARNRLGRWWLVILPVLQATTYGLIFGLILGANRPHNFLPFLFTGVFLFSFFQATFSSGATALTSNLGLVRSLSFPRALLPISAVIRQFLNLLPQIAILIVILMVTQQPITLNWLALLPILFLMVLFSTGLALVAARLTVQVRDLSKLIPFITRVAFYVSGIFFNVNHVLANFPTVLAIMQWNPVYDYVQLARGALVDGYEMTQQLWVASISWAFVSLLVGILFFWSAEERYGRD